MRWLGWTVVLLLLPVSLSYAQEPGPRSGAVIWFKGLAVQTFAIQESRSGLLRGGDEIPDPLDRRIEVEKSILQLAYSFLPDQQLFLSIPYLDKSQEWRDPQTGERRREGSSGLGDILLLYKYRFFRKDPRPGVTTQFSFAIGPELPLGRDDVRNGNGELLPPSLQPGRGTVNWLTALAAVYPRGRHEMGSSLLYKVNTEGAQQVEEGDWLELHTGYHYRFWQQKFPGGNAAAGPGLTWHKDWRDRRAGQLEPNSGAERLFLTFDGHYVPKPFLMFHWDIEWPIVQNVKGEQLKQGPTVAAWLHWQFALGGLRAGKKEEVARTHWSSTEEGREINRRTWRDPTARSHWHSR